MSIRVIFSPHGEVDNRPIAAIRAGHHVLECRGADRCHPQWDEEAKQPAWFKKGSFKVTVARQIRPSLRGGSESTGWVELSGSEELEP